MIRQGNVVKPVDIDIDNDENDAESSDSKRSLIRQYSDPTPQQNQIASDPLQSSGTSANKSKYLSVTNSHLQKQNSDSALTVPREGQPSTLLTDLINDPIKSQVKKLFKFSLEVRKIFNARIVICIEIIAVLASEI